MRWMTYLSEGFRIARRHKRLVVALWLLPLIPALVLGTVTAVGITSDLGRSLYSDRVLDGNWASAWFEYRGSTDGELFAAIRGGVVALGALMLLLQVVASAGVVESLLERGRRYPFLLGIRRNLLRFLRSAAVLLVVTVPVALLVSAVVRVSFKLAASQADGRLDLLGIAVAAGLFVVLWAPLDLASDLSRIAAARHDDRSMVRGFFRALGAVLRNPGIFAPLYVVFIALPLLLHLVYYVVRAPWTPATAVGILLLVLAQQAVMIVRAFLKLGFWGVEVTAYRALGESRWCRSKAASSARRVEAPGEAAASL